MKLFVEAQPLQIDQRFLKVRSAVERVATREPVVWVAGFGSYFNGKPNPNDMDLVIVARSKTDLRRVQNLIESSIQAIECSVPLVSSVIHDFDESLKLSHGSPDIEKMHTKLVYLGHAIQDEKRRHTLYGQIPGWIQWYCLNLGGME